MVIFLSKQLWWKNQIFVKKFGSEKTEVEKWDLAKILVAERPDKITTNMLQWQVLDPVKLDMGIKLISELNLCCEFYKKKH